ncbi:amino acid transporter [Liquorilactobacillus sucicola DSM 21376 = JCM 15457]|uniref:Amino acid transporter n=1 Tax=Liquorilactobacillus sucicola DSM 21376 = JCM 15457 TaxID=1423806 RepID=A0A0R2DSI7_9LACO|nr:APC family permease [Liquorilactobacillus sucicola]KRN06961.1 amino acid transporter [Liquorilactobacillus sucicola DSM 21376 = JCM 15457]
MPRKMSLFSIVMLTLSAIIGSGWLFGSGMAAHIAGPAAILSWILGGIIIGVIALNYIELGTMFPTSGGMSQYASFSHGPLLGFVAGWANWISLLTIIPIEAVAAVQYMSSWPWAWANWTRVFIEKGDITNLGLTVVFLFMLAFTLLNFWSIRLLTSFTSLISIFKIIIPLLTIIILLMSGFHSTNFHTAAGFMPYGSAALFTATTSAGIIFSYNAFQTTINMGNEIEKPEKNIFWGIVIAFGISMVIYTFLQVAFIGAVPAQRLETAGWQGISFQSPFADIAILLNLSWLANLLYLDAFISPFGTGVSFVATTSRALAAMTQTRHLPTKLGQLNQKYKTPRRAMVVNLFLGVLMVAAFRNWGTLSNVISTSTLIAYLTGPVTLMSFRKRGINLKRPFRLHGAVFLAPVAYTLASLAIYWAKWPTTIEVFGVIALGLVFYTFYELRQSSNRKKLVLSLRGTRWLFCEMVWLTMMSLIGSKQFGGSGLLPYPIDFAFVAFGSVGCYFMGVHDSYTSRETMLAYELNQQVKMNK